MRKFLLYIGIAGSSLAFGYDSQNALYSIKASFEQEMNPCMHTQEQQQILDALSLADHADINDFIQFLQENALQPVTQQALYISAAIHAHTRLKNQCEFLVKMMYIFDMHQQYWEQELYLENQSLYQKFPDRWLYSSSYTKKIQTHIDTLAIAQDMAAQALGKSLCLLHELSSIKNIDDIQLFFELISAPHFFEVETETAPSIKHPAVLGAYMLYEYTQHIYSACTKTSCVTAIPAHVERNKFAYAACFLGLIAGSMALYKNFDVLKDFIQKVFEVAPPFVKNNFTDPLCNMYDMVVNRQYREIKDIKGARLDTDEAAGFLKASQEKYNLPSLQATQARHQETLIHAFDWTSIPSNFYAPGKIWDAAMFNVKNSELQIRHSVNELVETLQSLIPTIRQGAKTTQLTLEMQALLPVAFLGWTGYKMGDAGYEFFFRKQVITKPFENTIRALHILLNAHIHEQQKDFKAEGYLYFYTQILHIISNMLAKDERALFHEDILLLQKYEYSYQQKFNIIQRMYSTYLF